MPSGGAVLVAPDSGFLFILGALFTCFIGTHASLQLAATSIRLKLRRMRLLTALSFNLQGIFCLHFVAMCGMAPGVPWGFDVGLTLLSLLCGAGGGTVALAWTLTLRQRLEAAVRERFAGAEDDHSFRRYALVMRFVLGRVSVLQLLTAVVPMVVGAAGCHHLGMWSMRGTGGLLVATKLTYWSLLLTVGVGGLVCVAIVLAFLLVPEGVPGLLAATALTAGVAAFHFLSAGWGMDYVLGEDSPLETGHVMGQGAVMIVIVLQGLVSQVVVVVFSQTVLAHYRQTEQQRVLVEVLGQCIAHMDLERAAQLECESTNPSKLELILFHIVHNLQLYRPYLPDTLFMEGHDSDNPTTQPTEADSLSLLRRQPTTATSGTRSSMLATDTSSESSSHLRLPEATSRTVALYATRRPSRNLTLGLHASRVTVLRVHLWDLDFGNSKSLNHIVVEEQVHRFMDLVTHQIKAHTGTLVMCSGGTAVGLWPGVSPEAPTECALAIQAATLQAVTQVIQCGPFLTGNLASQQFRSFNLLGPLDWPGQLLLRVGPGQNHIFITSREWEPLHFKYRCLPYDRFELNGDATTVYVLSPLLENIRLDNEWMYQLATHQELLAPSNEKVEECWQAYTAARYGAARATVLAMTCVPQWYAVHLLSLINAADQQGVHQPLKSLDAFGWVPSDQVVSPLRDV